MGPLQEGHKQIEVAVSPEVDAILGERAITLDDVRRVIAHGHETGTIYRHTASGHYLASFRPGNTTYWVEYSPEKGGFRIFAAYSHRMLIIEGFNLPAKRPQTTDWLCEKCGVPLEMATVKLTYLDETFAAGTPACPRCGGVFISETDAVEKMALAEKMLEDK